MYLEQLHAALQLRQKGIEKLARGASSMDTSLLRGSSDANKEEAKNTPLSFGESVTRLGSKWTGAAAGAAIGSGAGPLGTFAGLIAGHRLGGKAYDRFKMKQRLANKLMEEHNSLMEEAEARKLLSSRLMEEVDAGVE